MGHDQVDRGRLLVGCVAVPDQQPADGRPHPGTYLLLLASVDGDVLAYGLDELARDRLEGLVAHLEHRGVVLADRVVERHLVVAQTELRAAVLLAAELPGQCHQPGDDRGGFAGSDGSVRGQGIPTGARRHRFRTGPRLSVPASWGGHDLTLLESPR